MKRLHRPRRHSLTFEIPGSSSGVNALDFCSYEQIMGMEISYDIPDELLEELGLSGRVTIQKTWNGS